jgi:hypothetical protein
MSEPSEERIAIDFIDPLFAVVLNVSFAQVMQECWFQDFSRVFHAPYNFEVATLVLAGYLTVILSWVGYHRSISKAPLTVGRAPGFARFILDILLLIAYFILLAGYKNFQRELWTLVFIFALFVVWDQCKRWEWPDRDLPYRRGITVFWLIVFFLSALIYQLFSGVAYIKEALLGAIVAATILYRVHKDHPWPMTLLVFLGWPRRNA